MSNTSATGGYLAPALTPAPLEDTDFEDFLQEIFVGITGLAGENVFPRWQTEPPNLPDVGTDWAALGISGTVSDTYAVELHDPAGDGADQIQRHETVNVLISTYGPNAYKVMAQFRDGLQVAQNREVLTVNGMGLVDTGDLIPAPTLIKNKWLRRVDMRWTVRRAVWRTYPILNLLSAQGSIYTVDLTTRFNA